MFWPLKLFEFRFTVRLSYNFQLKFIFYSKILRIGRLFSWERYIAYCVIKRSAIGCKLDKKKLVVALGGRKCYQRYQLNHKKKNFIGTNVQSKKPASVSNLCAFMVYEQNGSITNHISFFRWFVLDKQLILLRRNTTTKGNVNKSGKISNEKC